MSAHEKFPLKPQNKELAVNRNMQPRMYKKLLKQEYKKNAIDNSLILV